MLKWFRDYIIIIMCCMTWDTLQCEFIFLSVTRREICADATYSVHISKVCAARIRINSHQYHIIYILISYELLQKKERKCTLFKRVYSVSVCVAARFWQMNLKDRLLLQTYYSFAWYLNIFYTCKIIYGVKNLCYNMQVLRVCLIKWSLVNRNTAKILVFAFAMRSWSLH